MPSLNSALILSSAERAIGALQAVEALVLHLGLLLTLPLDREDPVLNGDLQVLLVDLGDLRLDEILGAIIESTIG